MAALLIKLIVIWAFPAWGLVSTATREELREVTVSAGQDAFLQCQAPTDGTITLLEWRRPELEADGFLFFYRDHRSYKQYQHPSFRGRVRLADPQMEDGNMSVILHNATEHDSGIYKCRIVVSRAGRSRRALSEMRPVIKLDVMDRAPPGAEKREGAAPPDGDSGGCFKLEAGLAVFGVAVILAVVVGIMISKRHMKKKSHLPPDEEADLKQLSCDGSFIHHDEDEEDTELQLEIKQTDES